MPRRPRIHIPGMPLHAVLRGHGFRPCSNGHSRRRGCLSHAARLTNPFHTHYLKAWITRE